MNPDSYSYADSAIVLTHRSAVPAVAEADAAPSDTPFVPSGSRGPGFATPPNATNILKALHRRQLLALCVAVLVTAISGAGSLVSWFPLRNSRRRLGCKWPLSRRRCCSARSRPREADDYKRYQNTQKTLVTSQLSLTATLQDKDVSNYRMVRAQVDPMAWLQANLKVEFIAGSEVMEISLSGDNPDELAGVVNGVKKLTSMKSLM